MSHKSRIYGETGHQMPIRKHPLAEVFGHLTTDMSLKAKRFRAHRLCPLTILCQTAQKTKPRILSAFAVSIKTIRRLLPVQSVFVRTGLLPMRQHPLFDKAATWSSLTEVRMNDSKGKSAGNIDMVLVAYDNNGKVYDFGALEIQAVYISGNVREPFEHYMKDQQGRALMDWSKEPNYPRPDYLSSSRKRLVPQLLFKGGILHSWGKKTAVALNKGFFATLPKLEQVPKSDADIAWLIYDLEMIKEKGQKSGRYALKKVDEVFTKFEPALLSITTPSPGKVEDFIKLLQEKLDEQLETPPVNKTIERPF